MSKSENFLKHFLTVSEHRKKWILFIASCLLAYPAYSWRGYALLSFVSFVPFFLAIRGSDKKNNAFRFGFFFGAVFFAINSFWIFSIYPLRWLGINSSLSGFLSITLFFLFYSAIYGTVVGIWSRVYAETTYQGIRGIIAGGALWIVAEYAAAYLIGTFSFSKPGPHGIFGNIGTPLADVPYFLRLAEIGGMSALSLFVVVVNLSIASFFSYRKIRGNMFPIFFLFGFLAFPLLIIFLYPANTERPTLHSAVFTTAIHSSNVSDFHAISESNKQQVRAILQEAMDRKNRFDLMVFPENVGVLSSLDSSTRLSMLDGLLSENKGAAIDSEAIMKTGNEIRPNVIRYYGRGDSIIADSEKLLLVPFGEYLPKAVSWLFPLIGLQDWLDRMDFSRNFFPQPDKNLVGTAPVLGGGSVAAFFCSEILSQELYSKAARQGARVLVNVSSQSIFNGNKQYFWRTVQWSKIHAATHQRSFIMSGNYSPSFVLDPQGNIVKIAPEGTSVSLLEADVPIEKRMTLFDRIGFDWVPALSLLVVLFLSGYSFRKGSLLKRHDR